MKTRPFDYVVALVVTGLVLFGIVMVFSASYYDAQVAGGSGLSDGIKQAILSAVGMAVMTILIFFRYTTFNKWRITLSFPIAPPYRTENRWRLAWRSWPVNANMSHGRSRAGGFRLYYSVPILPALILLVSYGLLVYLFFAGEETYGATRWLTIGGISIQPSEIARFGMLLFIADDLAANHKQIKRCESFLALIKVIMPSFLVAGLTTGLILSGKSMSMGMTALFLFFMMLIAAGVKGRHLGIMVLLGLVLATGLILMEPFRVARMAIFRDPWQDPQDTGYQLIQSLYALANGGLFGAGPGGSRQKFAYLTFGDSDFILSIIGEEYGFIGITLLIAVFGVLVFRGYRVANLAQDSYGAFLATGITSIVWIQLIINALVVTSSMPPTGLPLPFISAGGSSLVIFLAQMGVLLNISRHTRQI